MNNLEKLTESEEIVMKAVWDSHKEPVLSDITERLSGRYGKEWAPQTVSTFLSKLVRKDYLLLHRNGKRYTYEVLVREREYQKAQLKHLAMFLYNGNKEQLLADGKELLSKEERA